MSGPYKRFLIPLEEHTTQCRSCLVKSGVMKNIFEWGLVQDFIECTNVKVERDDGVSELLCNKCEETLMTCQQFRMQCQKSNVFLKSAAAKKLHITSNQQGTSSSSEQNYVSTILSESKLLFMITAPNMHVKISLPCPFCPAKYIKQRDLKLHLVQNHEQKEDLVINVQYYCSIKDCFYYIDKSKNNNYFNGRKNLNQHLIKVHMDRKHKCPSCEMNFPTEVMLKAHLEHCRTDYICQICNVTYSCNERLLVHLKRKHPDIHKQYKMQNKQKKKGQKRQSSTPKASAVVESKRHKPENERFNEYICDSPKRSFATQTRPEDNIKNDVSLSSCQTKNDNFETKTDEISTQTVFEDLLSLKSQNSEDESLFETVSLSDIQTQTFPLEFGLSRSNKETITDQSPDLSIKETQTCFCLCDSPKVNYRLFDSVSSSPCSLNLISSETQTSEIKSTTVKSDVLLSFNSAETQTCFDEGKI